RPGGGSADARQPLRLEGLRAELPDAADVGHQVPAPAGRCGHVDGHGAAHKPRIGRRSGASGPGGAVQAAAASGPGKVRNGTWTERHPVHRPARPAAGDRRPDAVTHADSTATTRAVSARWAATARPIAPSAPPLTSARGTGSPARPGRRGGGWPGVTFVIR